MGLWLDIYYKFPLFLYIQYSKIKKKNLILKIGLILGEHRFSLTFRFGIRNFQHFPSFPESVVILLFRPIHYLADHITDDILKHWYTGPRFKVMRELERIFPVDKIIIKAYPHFKEFDGAWVLSGNEPTQVFCLIKWNKYKSII